MNFLLLALAIIAALIALLGLATIIRVAVGNAHWNSGWAFVAHLLYVAVGGTVAVWLFSLSGVTHV
ncbi:hypothetical protein SEA_POPPER_59 [Arthrobacter phage Popper]|uniref:Uncharacterized protein n=1 Tax=Arthrobacter phage Popper TaxID=2859633 RepID=A0AAE7WDB5_9CAUD|nr:hypothetical protein QEO78_gp47 [Arthrobacter phage Popper]QYC54976.1 hypothetical protein SEA_POPPER_59 [Arthrobacter phage Popper]